MKGGKILLTLLSKVVKGSGERMKSNMERYCLISQNFTEHLNTVQGYVGDRKHTGKVLCFKGVYNTLRDQTSVQIIRI